MLETDPIIATTIAILLDSDPDGRGIWTIIGDLLSDLAKIKWLLTADRLITIVKANKGIRAIFTFSYHMI
jgi:hypothetical protein